MLRLTAVSAVPLSHPARPMTSNSQIGHAMNLVLEEANERIKMPLRKIINPLVRPRVRTVARLFPAGASRLASEIMTSDCPHRRPHLQVHPTPTQTPTPTPNTMTYAVGVLRQPLPAPAGVPLRAHLRHHAGAGGAAGRRERAVGLPGQDQGPRHG